MEKKELKERFFDRFFYAEDGSCDWDRWRKQDPSVVLEFILEELDKAREEGKGRKLQGWECPKCGSVYSPLTFECPTCKNSGIKVRTSDRTSGYDNTSYLN